MKFDKRIPTALLILAMVAACTKNDAKDVFESVENGQQSNSGSWPAYADATVSGKVFGQDWTAVTALARPMQGEPGRMTLELFAETKADACKTLAFPSTTTAWMKIPADYKVQEYKRSSTEGTDEIDTVTFSQLGEISKNVLADKTRLNITALKEDGFEASIYAEGDEANGTVSTINGKISVIDCTKQVSFDVWTELEGWYSLKSFDGTAQSSQASIVKWNTNNFYDKASSQYLTTLTFPLYQSVSAGSSISSQFGPMKGLGKTKFSEANGIKTWIYGYHGPLNYKGMDVTLNLDMTIVKDGNQVTVTYTLEIPSHLTKTTHTFVMTK